MQGIDVTVLRNAMVCYLVRTGCVCLRIRDVRLILNVLPAATARKASVWKGLIQVFARVTVNVCMGSTVWVWIIKRSLNARDFILWYQVLRSIVTSPEYATQGTFSWMTIPTYGACLEIFPKLLIHLGFSQALSADISFMRIQHCNLLQLLPLIVPCADLTSG